MKRFLSFIFVLITCISFCIGKSTKAELRIKLSHSEMGDTIIQYVGHTFRITYNIKFIKDDNQIAIWWAVKDVLQDTHYVTAFVSSEDGTNEEWTINLKNGRGKGDIKKDMLCLPPLTPRGRVVFVNATACYDKEKENSCYLRFRLTEERSKYSPPISLKSKWPSKDAWKNGKWIEGTLTDKSGNPVKWDSPRK